MITIWKSNKIRQAEGSRLGSDSVSWHRITCWMWHNELGLTFCEPDMERFRDDRLKVPLGPLVSMLKTWNLKRDPQRLVTTSDTGRGLRCSHWNQGMAAASGLALQTITHLTSLKVSRVLSPLCSLLPTDKTQIPARDINHSMTHLTHRPFSSAGHPIIRLNVAGSYEASESNG